MPTLAMKVKNDSDPITGFMNLLDQKIHQAKDMLVERYNWIISQNPASAKFMYENGLMLGYDGKTIESAMNHGTLALGQIRISRNSSNFNR